jgi:hypothetical protein
VDGPILRAAICAGDRVAVLSSGIQLTHANDDLIILEIALELPHHFLRHLTA